MPTAAPDADTVSLVADLCDHIRAHQCAKYPLLSNRLDSSETDITPRDELTLGKNNSFVATTEQQANLEFWRWIALAGLALLMFEWWFYHKRTA